jgi:hypothetical protein
MKVDAELLLRKLGWAQVGDLLTDPFGDYRITLADDLWRLEKFDDSDNGDGIAEPRWLDTDEGETLQELKAVLRSIGHGITK